MTDLQFKHQSSMAGLLIDGVEDTPFTGATLKMLDTAGVEIEIPYIQSGGNGQFRHVDRWFRSQEPPLNLQMLVDGGTLSLFGIQWKGYRHSSTGLSHGILRPSETVFCGRDGDFEAELAISEVRSRIDGLSEWTGYTSVESDYDVDSDSRIKAAIFLVEATDEVVWRQDAAELAIRSDWRTYNDADSPRKLIIEETVVLDSRFEERRPFAEHL